MEQKNSNKKKKDNKVYQVNTRLTEFEFQKLSALSKQAGVNNSTFVRRLISDGKVEIRLDGDKVIQKVSEIQNDFNKCHHMILERISQDEQEINSLKALKGLKLQDPPFRIRVENVACDLLNIKKDEIGLKMKTDEELSDCVNF